MFWLSAVKAQGRKNCLLFWFALGTHCSKHLNCSDSRFFFKLIANKDSQHKMYKSSYSKALKRLNSRKINPNFLSSAFSEEHLMQKKMSCWSDDMKSRPVFQVWRWLNLARIHDFADSMQTFSPFNCVNVKCEQKTQQVSQITQMKVNNSWQGSRILTMEMAYRVPHSS